MARWNMYLDDSATHGALFDKMLRPRRLDNINGGTPVTTAGGIIVAEAAERAINRDVNALRAHIQRHLNLPTPPELHMRNMWGKDLPPKKNPFYGVDRRLLFKWVRQAYDIIFKHGQAGHLRVAGVGLELPQAQEVLSPYCADERTKAEHAILHAHFPKAQQDFYNVMLNPLVRMIMTLVVAGDHFARSHKHDLHVFYDTSEASKGFAVSDGMTIFHDLKRLESVREIGESSPHESNLMQLADLVAYRIFRGRCSRYRKEHQQPHADDPGMEAALRQRTLAAHGLSLPDIQFESYHESLFAMLQIAYASQSARHLYPDQARKLFIPLERYHIPVDKYGSLTGFFPLFPDEVIEAWNGKRPLL